MRDYGDTDLVVHMLQRKTWCEAIAHFNEHSSLEGILRLESWKMPQIAVLMLSYVTQWIRF